MDQQSTALLYGFWARTSGAENERKHWLASVTCFGYEECLPLLCSCGCISQWPGVKLSLHLDCVYSSILPSCQLEVQLKVMCDFFHENEAVL